VSTDDELAATASELRCRGCGYRVALEAPYPFRCPNASQGDVDHVLRRMLTPEAIGDASEIFTRADANPFVRYRELLHGYQAARANGFTDADWLRLVDDLDGQIAAVDGRAFRVTPFESASAVAERLGVAEIMVKDESGNVSGSHKGRHLMGVMLWLEAARRLGLVEGGPEPPLAIASCGNAALAAAVVASAAERRLEVFVPTHANPHVVERLAALGARLHPCPREAGEAGDPCYLRFREALAEGAVPFTCQGNENGLTIDGGKTLAWEMVSQLAASGTSLDVLFLHVGGGALASSVIEGLREARDLGLLPEMPRIHAVQTTGAYPLVRAWRLLVDRVLESWTREGGGTPPPDDASRAALCASEDLVPHLRRALEYATTHRSSFMWPWEEEPHSIADGILDDETYDWMAVVEGLLETGGWPVLAREEILVEANDVARAAIGLDPCHTGTAGLAGALELSRSDDLAADARLGIIVSGAARRS
jgi:threonine synthase